jgi:hypothetical protein
LTVIFWPAPEAAETFDRLGHVDGVVRAVRPLDVELAGLLGPSIVAVVDTSLPVTVFDCAAG